MAGVESSRSPTFYTSPGFMRRGNFFISLKTTRLVVVVVDVAVVAVVAVVVIVVVLIVVSPSRG